MSKRYRFYCDDEKEYKNIWTDTPPVSCFSDINHEIDDTKVDLLELSEEIFRINVNKQNNNNNFSRILRFSYDPNVTTKLRRVKALTYKTGNMDSFDLQIYNITENIELLNVNITNSNQEITIELGAIDIIPATIESIIEINIKNNTSLNSSGIVYLDEIIFYT